MTNELDIQNDSDYVAGRFPQTVVEVMRFRKEYFEKTLGNSSYFGIEGLVILGNAKDVSEIDSLGRIDVCLISTSETYDTDFIEFLAREAKCPIVHVGTIFIKKGQHVDLIEEEWKKQSQGMGLSTNDPFRMVLVRTLSLL